jgi:hypothetical protein
VVGNGGIFIGEIVPPLGERLIVRGGGVIDGFNGEGKKAIGFELVELGEGFELELERSVGMGKGEIEGIGGVGVPGSSASVVGVDEAVAEGLLGVRAGPAWMGWIPGVLVGEGLFVVVGEVAAIGESGVDERLAVDDAEVPEIAAVGLAVAGPGLIGEEFETEADELVLRKFGDGEEERIFGEWA